MNAPQSNQNQTQQQEKRQTKEHCQIQKKKKITEIAHKVKSATS